MISNWESRTLDRLLSSLATRPLPEWFASDSELLLFGRLRIHANLKDRPFPARMDEHDRLDLRELLEKELWSGSPPGLQGQLRELDPLHWEFSSERWLQEPLHPGHVDARYFLADEENRDWLLMGEDHLRLSMRGAAEELRSALQESEALLARLDKAHGLAIGPKGERLCAHPFLCGTGAQLTLVLHVPAMCWWGRIEDILDPLYEQGFCYRTWQEGYGDFLLLENTSGDAFEDTRDLLERGLALLPRVAEEELACRQRLVEHRRTEVEDRVHRALSLCRNARQMGYPELVEHLSMLRLGRQLVKEPGWSLPPLERAISPLLMMLAPAHLALRGGASDGRQSMALRAKLLRSELA